MLLKILGLNSVRICFARIQTHKEAHAVLLPIADKFPNESMISYNLVC